MDLFFQRPLQLPLAVLWSGAVSTAAQDILLRKHAAVAEDSLDSLDEDMREIASAANSNSSPGGQAQRRLTTLSAQRNDLVRIDKICRSALDYVPVRRLPAEVLSQIFMEYAQPCGELGTDVIAVSNGSPKITHSMTDGSYDSQREAFSPEVQNSTKKAYNLNSPWTLSMVCKRWRDVALATPALWRSFVQTLRPYAFDHPEASARAQELMDIYLQRSGYCVDFTVRVSYDWYEPADLQWSYFDDSDDEDPFFNSPPFLGRPYTPPATHPILDTLGAHCVRWRDVSLNVTPDLLRGIGSVIRGNLPLLRRLKIDHVARQWSFHRDDGHTIDSFANCPSLREIDLRVPPHTLVLPWAQIQVIRSFVLDDRSLPLLLATAPELLEACIDSNLSWQLQPSARTPLTNFPKLSHLRVGPHFAFLGVMKAPALRRLEIGLPYPHPHLPLHLHFHPQAPWQLHADDNSPILSFLTRSACSIQHLELSGRQIPNNSVDIFNHPSMTGLTNLFLRSEYFSNELLESLSYGRSNTSPLTKLRHISLESASEVNEAVYALLRSRCPTSPHAGHGFERLSSVHIVMRLPEGPFGAEFLALIKQLRTEGVAVTGQFICETEKINV